MDGFARVMYAKQARMMRIHMHSTARLAFPARFVAGLALPRGQAIMHLTLRNLTRYKGQGVFAPLVVYRWGSNKRTR
jgi:hypothetical protein